MHPSSAGPAVCLCAQDTVSAVSEVIASLPEEQGGEAPARCACGVQPMLLLAVPSSRC